MEKKTKKLTSMDLFSVSGGGGQNTELDPSEVVGIKIKKGDFNSEFAFKVVGVGAKYDGRERNLGSFPTMDHARAFRDRYLGNIAGNNFN